MTRTYRTGVKMGGQRYNLEYEAVEEETDGEEEDGEKGDGREVWVGGVALRLPVDRRERGCHRRSSEGAERGARQRLHFPGAVRRFDNFVVRASRITGIGRKNRIWDMLAGIGIGGGQITWGIV